MNTSLSRMQLCGAGVSNSASYACFVLSFGLWTEDFDHEEAGSDDDAGVGYVEVGPVVVDDVDFEEVDDEMVDDAVVEVADGSAEDEGEGDGGE